MYKYQEKALAKIKEREEMAINPPGPGERRGGRQKGTPNVFSLRVKEAISAALESGDGPQAYFERLKEKDPKIFCTLLARILPKEFIETTNVAVAIDYATQVEVVKRLAFMMREVEIREAEENGTDVPLLSIAHTTTDL